jgi:hypothetical protein
MKIEELANKSRLFLLKNLNPKMDTKLACIDEIKNIILNKEFTLKPIDIGNDINNCRISMFVCR